MKLSRLIWSLAGVLLLVLAAALFTNLFGAQLIPGLPQLRLQQTERFATSSITLEEVREVYAFTTVRYVHRAVFPYDYLPEGVSLNEILRKLRTSDRTVRDTLNPEEYLYFQTYNLASDIQLSTSGGTFDFVVVSLVITAGFEGQTSEPRIRVRQTTAPDGTTGRRAEVRLPAPRITEVAVEDIDPADYPYPDTSLGADGWRRVAAFVREQSVSEEVQERILTAARTNGEEFLESVLVQAGFAEVEITYTHE